MRATGKESPAPPGNTSMMQETLQPRLKGFYRLIGPHRRHPTEMQLQIRVESTIGEPMQIRSQT
jgi:hypothetical protein